MTKSKHRIWKCKKCGRIDDGTSTTNCLQPKWVVNQNTA